MSADPIFTDGHYARYQAELEAAEDRLLAIERRALTITGAELQAKAYSILSALDKYASDHPDGWAARDLLNELMGDEAQ